MQFFKSLSFYSLQNLPAFSDLEEAMQTAPFIPATPTQDNSSGFIPPRGEEHGAMLESVAGWWIGYFYIERRSVPSSEVNKLVKQESERISKEEGRTVGRKEKRTLKDDAIQTLMPRAFSRYNRIEFAIDPARSLVVMNTTSQGLIDVLITNLVQVSRQSAAGSINPAYGNAGTLSHWLMTQEPPENFTLGRACQLDSIETKAKVSYRHYSLDTDGLRDQIRAGMGVDWVNVTYNDRMTFNLDSNIRITGLEVLDAISSTKAESDAEVDAFDTNAALFTGELSLMLPDLFAAFGLNQFGLDPNYGAKLTAFGSDATRPEGEEA